jgi:N-formylmaleamate deformylase
MIDEALRRDLKATDAESRTVDADGVRLHVLDYGGGGRPTLVLPGITSPAVTWDFVAQHLRDDAQVIVADLRGRGLSDHPPNGYALSDYAADAAALIRGLGLASPVLLGHSLGARIAVALDALHPGVAGELLLVDPPLSGPDRGPYPTPLDAFLTQLREAVDGTDAEGVQRHWPGWPERELELRARWLATCSETAVIETHRGFEYEDFFDVWPRTTAPAALVRGADSAVVTRAGADEAMAARPDASRADVPAAGHMVPWDNLNGFLAVVRPMLRRGVA